MQVCEDPSLVLFWVLSGGAQAMTAPAILTCYKPEHGILQLLSGTLCLPFSIISIEREGERESLKERLEEEEGERERERETAALCRVDGTARSS